MIKSSHHRKPHLYPQRVLPPVPSPVLEGVPNFRNQIRFIKSFDTGEWAHGRPEQAQVFYAASSAGLPLLCFGRAQRFHNGCRGAHHKIRPHLYHPVRHTFAFNLSDRSHVNALYVCLEALKALYYHKDRLVKEGVIKAPEAWSTTDPSPFPVELCRSELSTFALMDRDGREPDRAEQVVEARMVWRPYTQKWVWQLELVRYGWYGRERRCVRFLSGSGYALLVREESVPKLLDATIRLLRDMYAYVVQHPEQVKLGHQNYGGVDNEKANLKLYWNKRSYSQWIEPLLLKLERGAVEEATSADKEEDATEYYSWYADRVRELEERNRQRSSPQSSWAQVTEEALAPAYDPYLFQSEYARFYRSHNFQRLGRGCRRAGLLGQGFRPIYLKRLQALDQHRIEWLPTWSVDEQQASVDLAGLKAGRSVVCALTATILGLYAYQVQEACLVQRKRLHLPPRWSTERPQEAPGRPRRRVHALPISSLARGPPRRGVDSS